MIGSRRTIFALGQNVFVPSGFGWTPPFPIYHAGHRFDTPGWEINSYAPTGQAYYVATDGDEANDGLTPATPFKRVRTALAKADIKECWIKAGIYPYYRSVGQCGGWDNYALAKSVAVRKYGTGSVILSLHEADLVWALSGGTVATYEAVRTTAITDVRDSSMSDVPYGGYKYLTKRASVALVDANPGSWYDDGAKIYIRTHDSRIPDAYILPFMGSIGNGYIIGHATVPVVVFIDGIEFHGGTYGLRPTAIAGVNPSRTPAVYLKDCAFRYSNGAGLLNWGAISYMQNCTAEYNNLDAIDYNSYNSSQALGAEIGCVARWNGVYSALNQINGSTLHDDSRIIRLMGQYYQNKGPNVHDVQTGQSWNLGCLAHDSLAAVAPLNCNFACGYNGVDATEMWLDSCTSYNAGAQADLYVDDVSTLYYRRLTAAGVFTGAGALRAY